MMPITMTQSQLSKEYPQLADAKSIRKSSPKLDAKESLRNAWLLCTDAEWPFEPEVRFDAVRKWRLDWADRMIKLGIEVDGVVRSCRGRHQTITGLTADYEKTNAAAQAGWIVLHYTPQMIKSNPYDVVNQILAVMKSRKQK